MYSATPIGGSTALKRAGSTQSKNTRTMGTSFGTEYASFFRPRVWVQTGAPTHAHRRHRRHHRPQATGYGRP